MSEEEPLCLENRLRTDGCMASLKNVRADGIICGKAMGGGRGGSWKMAKSICEKPHQSIKNDYNNNKHNNINLKKNNNTLAFSVI